MLLPEFINETSRLEKYFDKTLNKVQRDEWYKHLMHISAERYRKIIDVCIVECRFLPKLADILETQRSLTFKVPEERDKVKCDICNGTGYVLYKKHFKNGYRECDLEYAARCVCANGMSKNKDIPLISEINLN